MELLHRFSQKSPVSNFMSTHPVGAMLKHAAGQTDGLTACTIFVKESDVMAI
jgi:hypothetical protein